MYLLLMFVPQQNLLEMQSVVQSIRSPGDYTDILPALVASVLDQAGTDTRKQQTQKLLQAIANILNQPQSLTLTKFYAVMVAKDLSMKNYPTFLSVLANSPLLNEMTKLCRMIDPDKKEKGESFGDDKIIGGKFMALITECITVWAEKYPLTSQRTPSRFKAAYADLIADGVTMPREFIYFQNVDRRTSIPNYVAEAPQTPSHPVQSIQQYIPAENFSTINKEPIGYESQDSAIHEIAQHKVNPQQQQMYRLTPTGRPAISPQDLPVFPPQQYHQPQQYSPPQQYNPPQPQYPQPVPRQIQYADLMANIQQHPPNDGMTKTVAKQLPQQQQQQVFDNAADTLQFHSNSIRRQIPFDSQGKQTLFNTLQTGDAINEVNTEAMDRFLTSNSRPGVGFNSIRAELENQKNTGPGAAKRQKERSANISNVEKFWSTTIIEPSLILKNVKVDPVNYQGELVQPTTFYSKYLNDLTPGQTLQRFKKCLIKNKNILYEDNTIQIGFKSEFVYDVDSEPFQLLLNFILFFGNKTQQPITHFHIKYHGDKTNILYCTPPKVSQLIQPNSQVKQDLMVVPNQIPCGLIIGTMHYKIGQTPLQGRFLLPNTILKLSKLLPLQPALFCSEFLHFKSQGKIFLSPIFALSKTFQPHNILKYIPELTELTSLSAFQSQQQKEYILGCGGQILESDDFLLKIRIRADMTCVIQVGALDCDGEDAGEVVRNITGYVQALQFMMMAEHS